VGIHELNVSLCVCGPHNVGVKRRVEGMGGPKQLPNWGLRGQTCGLMTTCMCVCACVRGRDAIHGPRCAQLDTHCKRSTLCGLAPVGGAPCTQLWQCTQLRLDVNSAPSSVLKQSHAKLM